MHGARVQLFELRRAAGRPPRPRPDFAARRRSAPSISGWSDRRCATDCGLRRARRIEKRARQTDLLIARGHQASPRFARAQRDQRAVELEVEAVQRGLVAVGQPQIREQRRVQARDTMRRQVDAGPPRGRAALSAPASARLRAGRIAAVQRGDGARLLDRTRQRAVGAVRANQHTLAAPRARTQTERQRAGRRRVAISKRSIR